MADLIKYFNTERAKALAEARAIADKAEEEGRGMTDEESESAAVLMKEAKSLLRKAAAQAEIETLHKETEELGGPITPIEDAVTPMAAKTAGSFFVKSGAHRAVAAKAADGSLGERWTSESVEIPESVWRATMNSKAMPVLETGMDDAAGDVFGSPASHTLGILNTLLPGLTPPVLVRPQLGDLMPTIPVTTGNTATYPVYARAGTQLVDSSGDIDSIAGSVTEGVTKKALGYDATTVTKVLFKLAAYTKVSEELLEDAPGMAAFINADLPLQVRQAEEKYLSSVLYAGTIATTGAIGGSNDWDGILEAMNVVRLAGFEPDALVIHPTDWSKALVSKGGTSTGYLGGGPFSATNNPWGISKIVVTPAAVAGTALVGDFQAGAKVYRKGGLRVASTNSDGTDFITNLVTIRAEERLICGVSYTGAFCETAVVGDGS